MPNYKQEVDSVVELSEELAAPLLEVELSGELAAPLLEEGKVELVTSAGE